MRYEDLSKERNFKLNPPTYAPGQGQDEYSEGFGMSEGIDWGAEYSAMGGEDYNTPTETIPKNAFGIPINQTQGNSGFNTGFPTAGSEATGASWGGDGFSTGIENGYSSGYNPNPNVQPQYNQPMSAKERFAELGYTALEVGSKESLSFIQLALGSLKTQTFEGYRKFYSRMMKYGSILFILSLAASLVLWTTRLLKGWKYAPPNGLFFASAICALIGTMGYFSNRYYKPKNNEPDGGGGLLQEPTLDFTPKPEEWGMEEPEMEAEQESEDPIGGIDFDIDGFFDDNEEEEAWGSGSEEPDQVENVGVLDLSKLDNGLYTRKLLVDLMKESLVKIEPDFNKVENLDEDSSEFLELYDKVKSAADACNIPEENTPVLYKVYQTMFKTTLHCKVVGVVPNINSITTELENLLKIDDMGKIVNGEVTVHNTKAGKNVYFHILWNKSKLVTQGDVLEDEESYNFFTDTSNAMPTTWGIDESGDVINSDVKEMYSLIIAGESRSGKTEFLIRFFSILMFLKSPEELNVLLTSSGKANADLNIFRNMPHVIGIESDPFKISEALGWVIDVEGERRKKILDKYNFNNVNNYNKDIPTGEKYLPDMYILLDEMATTASELPAEDYKEYKKKLVIISTQFPYLNIKLIMAPHEIRDDMIPKVISNNVSARMMIKATPPKLKNGLDLNEKEFPYTLKSKGDSALRAGEINGGNPIYVYTPILSLDQKNKERFLKTAEGIWERVMPGVKAQSWNEKGNLNGNRMTEVNPTMRNTGDNEVEEPELHPDSVETGNPLSDMEEFFSFQRGTEETDQENLIETDSNDGEERDEEDGDGFNFTLPDITP